MTEQPADFQETVAVTALEGAASAVETSAEAAGLAETSVNVAVDAAQQAGAATETAAVAAAVASEASAQSEASNAVATASAEVAYATHTALQELSSQFTSFRESVEQRLSHHEQAQQTAEEVPASGEAEVTEIPVSGSQSPAQPTEGGDTSEQRRRRHRFGR